MSRISEAQLLVFQELGDAVKRFGRDAERTHFEGIQSASKLLVGEARSIRYEAQRLARLARAIEVLEAIEPHFQ